MTSRKGEWPTVSVVVPMYNARVVIEHCIESLQQQDYPLDRLEVVIADGDSTDGSAAAARKLASVKAQPRVTVIANPKRTTASGLNLGIAESRGAIIVRLDAHSEAAPDYVRRNVEVLEASGADYVGGRPVNVGLGYWGEAIALAMGSRFGVASHFRTSNTPGEVDAVAFGAFRRETFGRVGPFDEDLLYSEDNEYTHRIRAGGGRVYFDPAIRCTYHPRSSLSSLFLQYGNYGWGRMRHALRDGGGVSARHLVPMAFVAALALSGAASLTSIAARLALVLLLAAYAATAVAMAAGLAMVSRIRYLPALPLVFLCLHTSYGIGQWRAVAGRVLGGDRRARAAE